MNRTPKAIRPLQVSAARALLGVEQLGAVINIKLNDADTVGAVVYDLFGRPADPTATPPVTAIVGKQALYSEAKVQHSSARAELRQALDDGYDFVAQAVNVLRGELGRSWNSNWAALGFHSGSLRLPRNPLSVLSMVAAYFRTHPASEVAALDLTAAEADRLESAIITAEGAAASARDAEGEAKQMRDAAIDKMRMRIASLREELGTLLTAESTRWYRFGFRRPIDGETPDLVEELRLMAAGTGQVLAEWSRARLADNYRVSWRLASAGPEVEPTEVGLFTDQQAVIMGLASGETITVIVTARNASGESAPTEVNIVVP